jgi:hypothetical protein
VGKFAGKRKTIPLINTPANFRSIKEIAIALIENSLLSGDLISLYKEVLEERYSRLYE